MLSRIVVVAVCIVALMAALRDGRLLRATGLTATCTVVRLAADGSTLDACRPGKLEGRPNLSRRGCTAAGIAGTLEYWQCPAATSAAYTP